MCVGPGYVLESHGQAESVLVTSVVLVRRSVPRAAAASCGLGVPSKGKMGVCTMCTPGASDWFVHRPDWAGLRMFSGEWRICRGWSPIRVRFRRSGALWGL